MAKKKILFIEDEPDQIMLIKNRLEASGFEFASAQNGEEGLKKAKEEKPDLVLLDIIMPKMDGYEVCRELRKDPASKNTPVIAITASGERDIEKKCLSAGANAVIIKPYDSINLVNKIKELTATG